MDTSSWIYPQFILAAREYLLYLQHLSLLLVIAIAYIFYNHKASKSRLFFWLSIVTFGFGVITLISGLYLYSSYLSFIWDFIKQPDFENIRCRIKIQFTLAIITTVLTGFLAYLAKGLDA